MHYPTEKQITQKFASLHSNWSRGFSHKTDICT